MNQDVRIDREGLQNIKTGERSTMILADELDVGLDIPFKLYEQSSLIILYMLLDQVILL